MKNQLVYYYPDGHEKHTVPHHPEKPDRIDAIVRGLDQANLWVPYPKLKPEVELDQVLHGIHSPEYLASLKFACQKGDWVDQDTYLKETSYQLARETAGGAVAVVKSVWSREAATGFALCRPPGHHATSNKAMGFCLINNVAVAAQELLVNQGASRVAIIDIDLHHGNGTQDIFLSRSDVFYFSTHQSPLYPGSGNLDELGIGGGIGTTANFPMPPGTGDAGFANIFEKAILPLIDRYAPEMLLVSIGFDSHWLDPLGFLQLTAKGYAQIIKLLKSWADTNCFGRIALILEGGYNLQALEISSVAVVSALLDQTFQDTVGRPPYASTDRWQLVLADVKKLWSL
jgi:acetoin utilization deacetylase AcuC-like enzyme